MDSLNRQIRQLTQNQFEDAIVDNVASSMRSGSLAKVVTEVRKHKGEDVAREVEEAIRAEFERLTRESARNEEAASALSARREREAARREELAAEIESLHRSIEALIAERDTTDTDAREREGRKRALYERQRELDELLREQVASMAAMKDRVAQLSIAQGATPEDLRAATALSKAELEALPAYQG